MKTKIISFIIAITILFGMGVPVYAATSDDNSQINNGFSKSDFVNSVVKIKVTYLDQIEDAATGISYVNSFTGSGFFIDDETIVTAAHTFVNHGDVSLINEIKYQYVYNSKKTSYTAEIAYLDIANDICIIKRKYKDHTGINKPKPLTITSDDYNYNSSNKYYAVGFPKGNYTLVDDLKFHDVEKITVNLNGSWYTITTNKFTTEYNKEDALALKGISGGPIVDESGEVVGLMGYSSEGYAYGITLKQIQNAIDNYYTMRASAA